MDNVGEIYRFSLDGTLLSQFALSLDTGTSRFVISSSGLLFSFDLENSYGGIYNVLTEDYLGRYFSDASDVNDPGSPGG